MLQGAHKGGKLHFAFLASLLSLLSSSPSESEVNETLQHV